MTTMTLPVVRGRILRFPTRAEVRAMLTDPAIARTVIRCVTLFGVATIAAVVFLAYTGHDTAVVGAIVGGPLVTVLTVLAARLKAVHEAVKVVQTQQGTPDA